MNFTDSVIKKALLAIYARPNATASKENLALDISLGIGGDLQKNFDLLREDLLTLGFSGLSCSEFIKLNEKTVRDIFFNRNAYITLAG